MNWKLIRIIDRFAGIPLVWFLSLLATKTHKLDTPPSRILLIKFWGIGNLFMLLPAIQALRTAWPETAIDFLTLTSNHEAMEITGLTSTIACIDTGSPLKFLYTVRTALQQLRSNRYDLIIDFEQFARFSALLTYRIGAPCTIGFATNRQHRHHLYTSPVMYNNDIHITRSFFQLVEQAGVTTPFTSNVALRAITQLHEQGKHLINRAGFDNRLPVAVMHIGTSDNFMERRWAPQRYAALCDLLAEHYKLQIFLTGLANEKHLVIETMSYIKQPDLIRNMSGVLTFRSYFSLIATSDLVISADTAAIHIASSLDIPVAGLYGPNTPDLYGPWKKNGLALYAAFDCSPCITNFNSKINTCRHPDGRGACMNALNVKQVFTTIENNFFKTDSPFRLAKLASL